MAYITLKEPAQAEYTEKKSVFTARCFHVDTEAEALALLEDIRRGHRDARHSCWAYTVGDNGSTARFSDDGEPSGTAGMPIMTAIRNRNLQYTLCVVTRYFGGVLLGAGNLTRAYGKTAGEALAAAKKVYMDTAADMELEAPYPMYGRLTSLLCDDAVAQSEAQFAESVKIKLLIKKSAADGFIKAATDATDGTINVRITGERLYPFETI